MICCASFGPRLVTVKAKKIKGWQGCVLRCAFIQTQIGALCNGQIAGGTAVGSIWIRVGLETRRCWSASLGRIGQFAPQQQRLAAAADRSPNGAVPSQGDPGCRRPRKIPHRTVPGASYRSAAHPGGIGAGVGDQDGVLPTGRAERGRQGRFLPIRLFGRKDHRRFCVSRLSLQGSSGCRWKNGGIYQRTRSSRSSHRPI